jgi:Bacterial Ig-like domain/Bacterial Ig domain
MKKICLSLLLGAVVACTPTPPPPPLTVSLTQPSNLVYTNGTVAVQAVVGGNPENVELLKNNTVLSVLNAPYSFSWNTSSETEASYELKIRIKRGSETLESAAQTVVVDRTPPTLTSRKPAATDTNVYLADEISLTANEALLPSSVSASTVFLKKGTTVLEDVPVQVSLENQNKILLRPTVLPPLPETFRTTLGAVTDLAGNTLQIPDTTFSAPDWQFVGNGKVGDGNLVDLSDQALALGTDKQPVAAYLEEKGANATIRVKRFDGTAWQEFGTGAGSAAANLLDAPLLVLDGNTPIVAWLEGSSGSKVINVKRWDGTAWQTLGNALNSSLTGASNLQLAISKTGTVVVSRAQFNLLAAATQWRVSFLSGSQWQSYGDAYTKPANSSEAHLVLDGAGLPALAFTLMRQQGVVGVIVRRWNETTWTESGFFLSGIQSRVRMAFDALGKLVVCVEYDNSCHREDVTWQKISNVSIPNTAFVMQLESGGTPVVASTLDPDFGVVVKRVLPAGAVQINSVIDPADSPSSPNLVLDAQNNPYVLWEYSQAHEIHLRRANRIP